MSYDPPQRRLPPRQGGWPQATPPRPWRAEREDSAYPDDNAYRDADQAQPAYQGQPNYQGQPAYQGQPNYQDAFDGSANPEYRGYRQTSVADPFATGTGGYAYGRASQDGPADYYAEPGYAQPAYAEPGYAQPGYAQPGYAQPGYAGRESSGPALGAPDADVLPHRWLADRDRRRKAGRRGLIVGAVTGLLAAAVAIGVATLEAAFVGRQASPVIVVGDAFIDRVPAALKTMAADHFGQHGRTVLLLGMYVMIAIVAMAIGVLTRQAPALGVAAIAVFGLFGAFVTITRPQGQLTDVLPSVLGAIAGAIALLWLRRASAPVAPSRPAHSGGYRRA